MKRGRATEILREVQHAVSRWRELAEQAGVGTRPRAIAATIVRVCYAAGGEAIRACVDCIAG